MQKFHLYQSLITDAYFVVTHPPFYIGRVVKFEDDLKWAEYTNNFRGLALAQIVPYKIAVEISKSLTGVLYVGHIKGVQSDAVEMGQHYMDNVIKPNLSKFEKYLF